MLKKIKKKFSKKDKVIFSKKEIYEDLEKVKPQIVDEDDNPSWYHYVIVILAFLGIFGLAYLGFYLYESNFVEQPAQNVSNNLLYKYSYKVGTTTYNIYFHNDPNTIDDLDFIVEPTKLDVLNSKNFRFSFPKYIGDDNGQVAKGSTMLLSFFQTVYRYEFEQDDFVSYNTTNCSASTFDDKVIVFNAYSDEVGVFYNESNGCIEFKTNNPKQVVDLVDKFIYNIIK